jgi:hypothetical protein
MITEILPAQAVACAVLSAIVASKNRSVAGWGALGFLFGVPGFIASIAMGEVEETEQPSRRKSTSKSRSQPLRSSIPTSTRRSVRCAPNTSNWKLAAVSTAGTRCRKKKWSRGLRRGRRRLKGKEKREAEVGSQRTQKGSEGEKNLPDLRDPKSS